jgi:urea transport system ATP-binding protein
VSEPVFLEVRELCAGYGGSQVLFDVEMRVARQGAVAVLGRNGAGKTTLLRAIIGEIATTRGTVSLDRSELTRLPTESRIRRGIGYVPQEHGIFARLSVRENLQVGRLAAANNRRMIDRALTIFPKLGARLGQTAGTLSGGERKMLAIGRALLSDPKLLLLDEPTEGVWIGVIEEIAERLKELVLSIAVVIVEQHLDLALDVAASAVVLDRGRVALAGGSKEMRTDPRLLQYLAP